MHSAYSYTAALIGNSAKHATLYQMSQLQIRAEIIHFASKNGLSLVTECCRIPILTYGVHFQLQTMTSCEQHSVDKEVHVITVL